MKQSNCGSGMLIIEQCHQASPALNLVASSFVRKMVISVSHTVSSLPRRIRFLDLALMISN